MNEVIEEEKACGENTDCLDKVNTEIQNDIEILPSNISESSYEIMLAILELDQKMKNCCTNAFKEYQAKGTKIYDEILECIKSKF